MGSSRARVAGPLEAHAAGFVAELARAGIPGSRLTQLLLMAHVSRWRAAEGWTPAGCRWMRQSGSRLRGGRAATCSSGP
jgi:hypothetical protein